MGSINYFNVFIEIAEDCSVKSGEIPPTRGDKKTIANLQYEMLAGNPYKFTSDDVVFSVFVQRNEIPESEIEEQREAYFSKGQPCLRSSPLTKKYGWGIHSDGEGKVALYGAETEAYQQFVMDNAVKKTRAMRSKRA